MCGLRVYISLKPQKKEVNFLHESDESPHNLTTCNLYERLLVVSSDTTVNHGGVEVVFTRPRKRAGLHWVLLGLVLVWRSRPFTK